MDNFAHIPQEKIKQLQKDILQFYADFGRDLPWRNTTDPYSIMISEIMLQQTQVDRVINYYHKWLDKWSTVSELAMADRRDVLKMWMGLGYNNRAINLHRAAQKIVNTFNADVILGVKNYKEIPGIGPYTSCAVQIFSLNADIATVDTNVRRILIHELELSENIKDKELWDIAEQCFPKGKSRDWHNGLMDYGATFLTSRRSGIKPKTTQSTFKGSDREIRAKVLRSLLQKNQDKEQYAFSELLVVAGENCDEKRLQRILDKMEKEKILLRNNESYCLKKD